MPSFWNDPNLDPKRQYRFQVTFGNVIQPYFVKSVAKPSFNVGSTSHVYLTHTFNFPTRVTWNDINMTLVDPGNPDATTELINVIRAAGYIIPANPNTKTTICRSKFVKAIGNIVISQIDCEGNPIETWTLKNAFFTSVNFGQLAYASDEMVEISLTIKYDYAILTKN